MSHEIESIAWTGEVPWHGLGANVPQGATVAKMLKAAQIDWTVSKRPLGFAPDSTTKVSDLVAGAATDVPGFFALTRDSDNKVFDVVGPQYTPTQNTEAFSFFNEFVEAGDATMETMGSLHGGRMTWGLASLKDSFKLKGNDQVKGYLLLCSPHQQGKSLFGFVTSVRVVCNNTLQAALGSKQEGRFTFRHTRVFGKQEQEEAKVKMGIARNNFEDFAKLAKQLQAINLTPDQSLKIIANVLEKEPTKIETTDDLSKRSQMVFQAIRLSPGADLPSAKGTGWGLVNGATYAIDHQFRKTQDRRLREAWFGRGASLKAEFVNAVLEFAA